MILRKPYAFLIKYFQRINIILLGCVLFLFYKTVKFHQFTSNYLSTTLYNSQIDSISNYLNILTIFVFIIVFIIGLVLAYLLRKKNKPYFSYLLIVIVNLFNFIVLLYANNYFVYKSINGFQLITAKMINDLGFVANILYYPLIFILLIRSIGIDLKNFGFQEDKEFAEITEKDHEEVEVQVGFDKEKWSRKFKYYFRNLKYYVVEHKNSLLIVFGLVLMIGLIQFYNYYYVVNRVYSMNQTITSNNYKLVIKNTYLTDKDYSGNIISKDNSYFIVVDMGIRNLLNRDRNFDIEKVLLYVDDAYYVPTIRYNDYFKDMGELYKGKPIKPKGSVSYLLIYQIPKPKKNANFVLKYQDVGSTKLVQVKIKVVDISTFKDKGSKTYPEEFNIPINLDKTINLQVSGYDIADSASYAYKKCNSDSSCPIYTGTARSNNNKILHLRFIADEEKRKDIIDFINVYGKLKYEMDGKEKLIDTKKAVTANYQGNHVYLVVPSEIVHSKYIDLVFTIRAYQYTYHLKGE